MPGLYVYHERGAPVTDSNFVERIFRGPRVMVWGAFCGIEKSPLVVLHGDPNSARGGITAEQYLECLKKDLPSLMIGDGKVFMHDGAPIHRAKIVR